MRRRFPPGIRLTGVHMEELNLIITFGSYITQSNLGEEIKNLVKSSMTWLKRKNLFRFHDKYVSLNRKHPDIPKMKITH